MRVVFIFCFLFLSTHLSAISIHIDGKRVRLGYLGKFEDNEALRRIKPRQITLNRDVYLDGNFELVPSWSLSFEFDYTCARDQFLQYINGQKRKNKTGVVFDGVDKRVYVKLAQNDRRWPLLMNFLNKEFTLPGELMTFPRIMVRTEVDNNFFVSKFKYRSVHTYEVQSQTHDRIVSEIFLVFNFENMELRDRFHNQVSTLNGGDILFISYGQMVYLILPKNHVQWSTLARFLDSEFSLPDSVLDFLLQTHQVRLSEEFLQSRF